MTTDDQEWRPVPGWEGLYSVSDTGRVRSHDRTVVLRNGQARRYRGLLLSPVDHGRRTPIWSVVLSRPGCQRMYRTEALRELAFGPGRRCGQ